MRNGVFETQVERTRQLHECSLNITQARLMEAMNQPEFSLRLLLQRVADAFAISFPEPLLLGHAAHVLAHIFTRSDAESRQQRIRRNSFMHAVAKIFDGARRTRIVADAVLALCSQTKRIPGKP